ncbi:MAG TPA: xylan 1,4-beta-xylosidase [Verrucomicrobiae bacterium]|nr:xylan 1,4-beta-xylosidase [Verrucomicrobiae bacterium]
MTDGSSGRAGASVASNASAAPSSARIAWFDELGAQAARNRPAPDVVLPPPGGVRATPGRGHVTVDWQRVDGAAGYLVHRADGPDGPWEAIDHRAGDLLAVPDPGYLDTTGEPGRPAWYAVASLATIDGPVGPLSTAVMAAQGGPGHGDATIELTVDAGSAVGETHRPWRPIIGSEHLALLLRGNGPGGRNVGDELADAFRIVRAELGAESVRAHAIFHDSLGVYREVGGVPVHDFERVDAALDRLLATGLRPVIELSFMPRDLASDPAATVFDYRGIISPPRDPDRWAALVVALVEHLRERYGADEVRRWPFEVWNEPNLKVFWSADEAAYFALYDVSARAVKSVDPGIAVGGPATAAVGWVDDLLTHAAEADVPVDFISTHTYGLSPLDLRPITARAGRPELPLYWTEWGISPTHGSPINDSVWGAPLVCRGMRSAAGRLESLAYWVASDHFVELGEPHRLFHGGFGLLTVGNLRKPRFWAIRVLELLGDTEIAATLRGDGAGSLVESWATRGDDGRVAIAIWSGTLDQAKAGGDPLLDRTVRLAIDGLPAGRVALRHRRIDAGHSNIAGHWTGGDWPDDAGWERLHAVDTLDELEPERTVTVAADGRLALEFALPMPSVSLIEVLPAG